MASDDFFHAVDPEVIRMHSQVRTETGTRQNFRQTLISRDGNRCVWTGVLDAVGMHIIPWSKGDEAGFSSLQLTVTNLIPNCLSSGFDSLLQIGRLETSRDLIL